MDQQIRYIYTVEYHSSLKKKGISDTCYNVDELENIMQVKYTCHRRINIIQFHLYDVYTIGRASLVAQTVNNLPALQEAWV